MRRPLDRSLSLVSIPFLPISAVARICAGYGIPILAGRVAWGVQEGVRERRENRTGSGKRLTDGFIQVLLRSVLALAVTQ